MLFLSKAEINSTSQRGEINGLLEALKYAKLNREPDEMIIIISDSEYLCNTVTLEWAWKWQANDWQTSTGALAKNMDLWQEVVKLVDFIGRDNVCMQWVKGHLISYTKGNARRAMAADSTGIELYTQMLTMLNRPSEKDRVVKELKQKSREHEISGDITNVPDVVLLEWVSMNIMADLLADYIVTILDALPKEAEASIMAAIPKMVANNK